MLYINITSFDYLALTNWNSTPIDIMHSDSILTAKDISLRMRWRKSIAVIEWL